MKIKYTYLDENDKTPRDGYFDDNSTQ